VKPNIFESAKPAADFSTFAILARCWSMKNRCRTRPAIERSDRYRRQPPASASA